MEDLANLAVPLHFTAEPKEVFEWTTSVKHETCLYCSEKEALYTPCSSISKTWQTIFVETHISKYSAGDEFSRKNKNGSLQPMHYASRTANGAEIYYYVSETKRLACTFALKIVLNIFCGIWTVLLKTVHRCLGTNLLKRTYITVLVFTWTL